MKSIKKQLDLDIIKNSKSYPFNVHLVGYKTAKTDSFKVINNLTILRYNKNISFQIHHGLPFYKAISQTINFTLIKDNIL